MARGVPPMPNGIQRGAALEGLLRDDGPQAGPLSAAHGALDRRGPVLVRAVVAGPLSADLCHRRAAAAGDLLPLRGVLSAAGPLCGRSHRQAGR